MATKDYSVYGEHAAMIAEMDADAEEGGWLAAAAAAPSPDLTFPTKTCAQCGLSKSALRCFSENMRTKKTGAQLKCLDCQEANAVERAEGKRLRDELQQLQHKKQQRKAAATETALELEAKKKAWKDAEKAVKALVKFEGPARKADLLPSELQLFEELHRLRSAYEVEIREANRDMEEPALTSLFYGLTATRKALLSLVRLPCLCRRLPCPHCG